MYGIFVVSYNSNLWKYYNKNTLAVLLYSSTVTWQHKVITQLQKWIENCYRKKKTKTALLLGIIKKQLKITHVNMWICKRVNKMPGNYIEILSSIQSTAKNMIKRKINKNSKERSFHSLKMMLKVFKEIQVVSDLR